MSRRAPCTCRSVPGVPSGPPRAQSTFYRLPTDGSPPSALNIIGGPLSILEAGDYLNVLLYDDREQPPGGQGDRPQFLRIPLRDFGDGTRWASRSAYRALPLRSPPEFEVQARFIGDVLVYGQGAKAGAPGGAGSSLFVIPSRGGAISEVTLPHDIDQIAWMGKDALALGAEGDHLRVSVVRLGREPRVVTHTLLRDQATTFPEPTESHISLTGTHPAFSA